MNFLTPHSSLPSISVRLVTYATVLVAFFLRAYRLADQNIWWDEGWSVWLSQKDLAWIALRTAADEHPPLHYWMLHFWNMLAGTDAFAGRFLSLAFGVLTVALMVRIGKRIGGAWVGVLAALFLAAARFHIWWSQDIKNYTPSIFFAFAAVWFALEILDWANQFATTTTQSRPAAARFIVAYALCAALALWTHYLAALVLLALNVYAVLVILSEAKNHPRFRPPTADHRHWHIGSLTYWLIANALAAVLFAPWMYLYLQNAAVWSAAPTFDFALFLKLVATVLPLGVTTHIEEYAALTIAFTAIAALGCVTVIAGDRRERSSHTLLFALIVLLPPILIYVLSLTPVSFFAPKIQARYLLVLLPAYVTLLALGIAVLRRFSIYLALATILLVLSTSAFVLGDYYAERRLRDEYATLANTINSFARQGDLVLLDTDQEWPTFLYYLRAPLEWLGAPNRKAMDGGNADVLVKRALARHDAVWLVVIPDALATDPQRLLESRLSHELPRQFEQTFGDKRLALYSTTSRDLTIVPRDNFSPQHSHIETAANGLQLLGFDLPVHEARAGDGLHVVTYWDAENAGEVVIGLQGVTTTAARVPGGERVRVQTDLVIPPDTRGDLSVVAGGIELARVRVEPRKSLAAAGSIEHPADYRLGDSLRLVGYDLPQTTFRAGENVSITLYWRADRAVGKSYTTFVHLLGTQFNLVQGNFLWGQVDRIPRSGTFPTTVWLPNEVVPDAYAVNIDPNAPSGTYSIEVGLYDAATGARLPVDSGGDSIIVARIKIK